MFPLRGVRRNALSNLVKNLKTVALCSKFDTLPKGEGVPGTGMGNVPRLTTLQTAVVVSPEQYDSFIELRDTVKPLQEIIQLAHAIRMGYDPDKLKKLLQAIEQA